jgi:hypothetical protein
VVKFESKMFHPNIYNDGGICLDILQNQWSPIYDVSAILTSIQSLLCDPNPNSPANSEAARLYSECKRGVQQEGAGGGGAVVDRGVTIHWVICCCVRVVTARGVIGRDGTRL